LPLLWVAATSRPGVSERTVIFAPVPEMVLFLLYLQIHISLNGKGVRFCDKRTYAIDHECNTVKRQA
jgi:hypothetical protein